MIEEYDKILIHKKIKIHLCRFTVHILKHVSDIINGLRNKIKLLNINNKIIMFIDVILKKYLIC